MTQICKLLDTVDYTHTTDAKELTEQVKNLRREMILDEYFADYDLSTFDEPFTDYELREQKRLNTKNTLRLWLAATILHTQK